MLALAGGPALPPISAQPLFPAPSGAGTAAAVPGRGLDLGGATGETDEMVELVDEDETSLRYWRRTLILAVLAAALLALSWWQQNHPALTTISQP
jgi:hypothetical protein